MTTTVALFCRDCRARLGETDGATLHVGQVVIHTARQIACASCGTQRRWEPRPPTRDNNCAPRDHEGTL